MDATACMDMRACLPCWRGLAVAAAPVAAATAHTSSSCLALQRRADAQPSTQPQPHAAAPPPHLLKVVGVYVVLPQLNAALCRLLPPHDQAQQRALPRPAHAHQGATSKEVIDVPSIKQRPEEHRHATTERAEASAQAAPCSGSRCRRNRWGALPPAHPLGPMMAMRSPFSMDRLASSNSMRPL